MKPVGCQEVLLVLLEDDVQLLIQLLYLQVDVRVGVVDLLVELLQDVVLHSFEHVFVRFCDREVVLCKFKVRAVESKSPF